MDSHLLKVIIVYRDHRAVCLLIKVLFEAARERYLDYSLVVSQIIKHLPSLQIIGRVLKVEDREGALC